MVILSLGEGVFHAFMSVVHVSFILEFLFHMHGVGHGCKDVTMGMRMSLCEACFDECMTSYMLLFVAFMYHFVGLDYIHVC